MCDSGVAALRVEISDLTLAISRQKQILDDMQSRLRILQIQLVSITHPVLSLPPEITSEIFIHCLPAEREWDVVNTEEAPLLLTHICKAWRDIAISTPALWTTFEVVDAPCLSHFSEIADTWIKRARECPLFLSIMLNSAFYHNSSLADVFQRHSRKIRSLELDTFAKDLSGVDSRLHEFTLLRELMIWVLDGDIEHPLDTFSNAPLLHQVSLRGTPPSFLALPWQQLTEFAAQACTRADCLEALELMPNMIKCTFSKINEDNTDTLDVFSHPNIQHLTLSRFRGADVLEILTLPALQTLELRDVHLNEAVLDQFIQRSSPPLRELSVQPTDQEGGTELKLSSAFTSLGLTDLEVWYPAHSFVASFLDLFAGHAGFLPQLQNLSFMGCRPAHLEATLLDIVKIAGAPMSARRQLAGCAHLKSFRVVSTLDGNFYSESMFPAGVLRPFKELKASGMDIHIGTTTTHSVL
ncbi:hypothetical protein B0H19DRAFT_1382339 [Mycena capillaripes]|nr:hypothetical protein B0H19DRAFT_1382339 [Mycena capillaripes]